MKICIPTEDDRGMDARLSDHFGSAPCFTFFDTESGRFEVMANARQHHQPGQCDPTESLRTHAAGVVVCRGLGRRALERLRSIGVEVFATRETTARAAVEAYTAGTLALLASHHACGGHGDCDHDEPRVP